jgi:hypothetical protein
MSFKVLSPIAELNRINSDEEHESMGSSSIDQMYESTNSSKHEPQQIRSRIEFEKGISVRPHKSSILGDAPNAFGVAADNYFHPHTIEENPGDEIWKKIVFGCDSEEVDIFVNDTLESDAPRFIEQSLRPLQPMSDSMLSFVDNFPTVSTNNFIPSSTSRQPSVSDFRSQLVRDGSYDTSRAEIGFSVPTIEIDYHSTAGNADSLDASSVYFHSSGSPVTQTTEVAPTNVAQRGSSIDNQGSIVSPMPKKRFAITQPTQFHERSSDSLLGEYAEEPLDIRHRHGHS